MGSAGEMPGISGTMSCFVSPPQSGSETVLCNFLERWCFCSCWALNKETFLNVPSAFSLDGIVLCDGFDHSLIKYKRIIINIHFKDILIPSKYSSTYSSANAFGLGGDKAQTDFIIEQDTTNDISSDKSLCKPILLIIII